MDRDDRLEDFEPRMIRVDGLEKRVYVAGKGAAIIVIAELPGISPHVARFARWVRESGFTVYMPSLFGRDGAVATEDHTVAVYQKLCVSAEFRAFGGNVSSPVTQWLRGLARLAHGECGGGGRGVGAIGMCFTGNFALSMMLEDSVLAPVLCQPSLPLDAPGKLESSQEELVEVKARLERDDLSVLAYRFAGDRVCTAERFAAYGKALGDRFVARILPDEAANPVTPPFFAKHIPFPHNTVTVHLIDEAGQPTIKARDEIIAFFQMRLAAGASMSNTGINP